MRKSCIGGAAALAIALSGCSGTSSGDTSTNAGGPTPSRTSSTPSATKVACTKVQEDLRSAVQVVAPGSGGPARTLQAARDLADRLDADVRDSGNAKLISAVGTVAATFRDIAKSGSTGNSTTLVQSIQKIAESTRRVTEICSTAGAGG